MTNVEQRDAQMRFLSYNRTRILKDYDGGFGVIEALQFRHYKTRKEVYEDFPGLASEPIFGNRPLLIDISEEQWKER